MEPLPITVQESWTRADALNLILNPPASVLDDTLRLGEMPKCSGNMALPLIQVEGVSFQYEDQVVLGRGLFYHSTGRLSGFAGSKWIREKHTGTITQWTFETDTWPDCRGRFGYQSHINE